MNFIIALLMTFSVLARDGQGGGNGGDPAAAEFSDILNRIVTFLEINEEVLTEFDRNKGRKVVSELEESLNNTDKQSKIRIVEDRPLDKFGIAKAAVYTTDPLLVLVHRQTWTNSSIEEKVMLASMELLGLVGMTKQRYLIASDIFSPFHAQIMKIDTGRILGPYVFLNEDGVIRTATMKRGSEVIELVVNYQVTTKYYYYINTNVLMVMESGAATMSYANFKVEDNNSAFTIIPNGSKPRNFYLAKEVNCDQDKICPDDLVYGSKTKTLYKVKTAFKNLAGSRYWIQDQITKKALALNDEELVKVNITGCSKEVCVGDISFNKLKIVGFGKDTFIFQDSTSAVYSTGQIFQRVNGKFPVERIETKACGALSSVDQRLILATVGNESFQNCKAKAEICVEKIKTSMFATPAGKCIFFAETTGLQNIQY